MSLTATYLPGKEGKINLEHTEAVLQSLFRLKDTVDGIIDHYFQIHLHQQTQDSDLYYQHNQLLEQLMSISKAAGPFIAFSTQGIQMDDLARLHHYQRENKEKKHKQSQSIMDYKLKQNEIKRALGKLDKEKLYHHIHLYQSEHLRYWQREGEGWVDDFYTVSDFLENYEWHLKRLSYLDHYFLAMNHRQVSPSQEVLELALEVLYDLETGEPKDYFTMILTDFKVEAPRL